MLHFYTTMRLKKIRLFFNRHNSFALGIIIISVLISIFIVRDPLHLQYSNAVLNLKPTEIRDLSSHLFNSCGTGKERSECYKTRLEQITKKYGMANGEAVLLSLQDLDDSTKNCHVIAHYMSQEAYKRSPWEFYKLVDSINVNACGSGFLHGILEAYIGDHPEIVVDGAFGNKLCGRGDDFYRQRMCIHFIGHIFLLNAYGNLEEVLPLCSSVKKEWQFDCYDGLFMEDHQKVILSDHGISPLPANDEAYVSGLEKRCATYEAPAGTACWSEMAEVYAHSFGYNSDIIFNRCSKANTPQFKLDCYFKGVIALAVYPTFNSPKSLVGLCSYLINEPKNYIDCVHVLTSALMYYSPKFIERGSGFCASIPTTYREKCFVNLTGLMKDFVKKPEERTQLCSFVPEGYKKICLN